MAYSDAERRLAHDLVRRGLATEEEVRAAAARHPDLSLQDSLLESGILSREELQNLSSAGPERADPIDGGSVTRTHLVEPGSDSGQVGHRSRGPVPISENSLVAGRYRIVGEVARGGMGVVYRAHDTRLDRICALKVCILGQMASASDVQRFLTEARAMAKLSHRNLLPIYDIGTHQSLPFYTMEFIEGEDLSDRVRAAGPLEISDALRICSDVAGALIVVHEAGIIHRDLKPANIMLRDDGRVVVMDFGLVKVEGSELTQSGTVLGTPKYMAPEQIDPQPGQTLDHRADIYALGAILYFLITGRAPHEGESMMQILTRKVTRDPEPMSELRGEPVPPSVEGLTLACLSLDLDARPSDCGAFLEAVSAIEEGRPTPYEPVSASGGTKALFTGTHALIGGVFLILGSLFLLVQFGVFDGQGGGRRQGSDIVATAEDPGEKETASTEGEEETSETESESDETDEWSLKQFDEEEAEGENEEETETEETSSSEAGEGGGASDGPAGPEPEEEETVESRETKSEDDTKQEGGTETDATGEQAGDGETDTDTESTEEQAGDGETETESTEEEPTVEESQPGFGERLTVAMEEGAPAVDLLRAVHDGTKQGESIPADLRETMIGYVERQIAELGDRGEHVQMLETMAWEDFVFDRRVTGYEEAFAAGFADVRKRLETWMRQGRSKEVESHLKPLAKTGLFRAFGYHFAPPSSEESPDEAAKRFMRQTGTYLFVGTLSNRTLQGILRTEAKKRREEAKRWLLFRVNERIRLGRVSDYQAGGDLRYDVDGDEYVLTPDRYEPQDWPFLISVYAPFWKKENLHLSAPVTLLVHQSLDLDAWADVQVRGGGPDEELVEDLTDRLGPYATPYLKALAKARERVPAGRRTDLRASLERIDAMDRKIAAVLGRLAEAAGELETSLPPRGRRGFRNKLAFLTKMVEARREKNVTPTWRPYLGFFQGLAKLPGTAAWRRRKDGWLRKAAGHVRPLLKERNKLLQGVFTDIGLMYEQPMPLPEVDDPRIEAVKFKGQNARLHEILEVLQIFQDAYWPRLEPYIQASAVGGGK